MYKFIMVCRNQITGLKKPFYALVIIKDIIIKSSNSLRTDVSAVSV